MHRRWNESLNVQRVVFERPLAKAKESVLHHKLDLLKVKLGFRLLVHLSVLLVHVEPRHGAFPELFLDS